MVGASRQKRHLTRARDPKRRKTDESPPTQGAELTRSNFSYVTGDQIDVPPQSLLLSMVPGPVVDISPFLALNLRDKSTFMDEQIEKQVIFCNGTMG